MVVLKIIGPKLVIDSGSRRSHSSYGQRRAEKEGRSTIWADSVDDYELAEEGCELGLVEQQLCSIPYELYELPDLREILSLDVWNSCLTEDERFSLSAFLPDMDEETFCLTMTELLGGTNIYFGNPVDTFFKRLKGGLYPPEVTHFREGFQFLQRRKYYHSLRSYHDNMAQMFIEMRRIWDQCDRSAGIDKRIDIWKMKRKCKLDYLLDLNTVPLDGYTAGEEIKPDGIHLPKKMKSVKGKRPNIIFPSIPNGVRFATANSSSQGVVIGSFEKHHPRILFSEMLDKHHSMPKGFLKMVPRTPSIQLEQSKMTPRQAQSSPLLKSQIFQDHKFSSRPPSLYFGDVDDHHEFPFPQQVGVNQAHSILDLEDPSCTLSLLDSSARTTGLAEGSIRKLKSNINPSLDDITNLGRYKLFGSDVVSNPYAEPESTINAMSTRRHNFGIQCYEREQHIVARKEEPVIVYRRNSASVSRRSDIFSKQEMLMASSSDQMKSEIGVSMRKSEMLFGKPSVPEGFKDETTLPLTYKRRKAQAKLSSFDLGRPLMAGIDLNSATPKDLSHQPVESTKAMKVKFTVWKEDEC